MKNANSENINRTTAIVKQVRMFSPEQEVGPGLSFAQGGPRYRGLGSNPLEKGEYVGICLPAQSLLLPGHVSFVLVQRL